MANDGDVNIGTKIDETGLDKGLASVDKKLKDTGKSLKSTFATMRDVMQGPVAIAGKLKDGIGAVKDVIDDLTNSYKTQIKAETQLESAAKNNPYLDSTSVQTLKNYASEIQSYSTYGDEVLLPMMAKLAAAGRTQDEIMQVMSAATDMAASGAFSLEAAVNNLNKSYGGLSGELGESIPEIKSLTAEQLKNGAAVTLLAGRYKGIAAEVAAATGTAEQLGNAFGALKEELGAPFEKGLGPIRTFFTELIRGWADAKKAKREMEEDIAEVQQKGADAELKSIDTAGRAKFNEVKSLTAALSQQLMVQKEGWVKGSAYNSHSKKELAAAIENTKKLLATAKEELSVLEEQYKLKESNIEAEKKQSEANAKQAEIDKKNQDTLDYIAKNTAAREKALKVLELQAATKGRSVTAEEKLNVYAQSYVALVSESEGKVSATNKAATSLLSKTKELAIEAEKDLELKEEAAKLEEKDLALKEEAAKVEEKLRGALADIEAADPRKESEKMADQLVILDEYYNKVMGSAEISANDKLAIEAEYLEKRKILLKNEEQAAKEEADAEVQARREKTVRILTIANDFATQYSSIMSSIANLAGQQIEAEATIKTAALEEEYAAGAISAEEYEKKLVDIKREAADEKYKIDVWVWGSQMLSAVANTALGVAQTLADATLPTLARVALGTLVGLAGAAQLTTIMASKPKPPSFATGGVVPGTSYTGDNVTARVNSAERVLTAQQNAAFERLAYGGGGAGDIKIYNSASNDVKATPEITEDGIKILIEKTVGQQMAAGRFNKSYRTMQNNLRGTRYTN